MPQDPFAQFVVAPQQSAADPFAQFAAPSPAPTAPESRGGFLSGLWDSINPLPAIKALTEVPRERLRMAQHFAGKGDYRGALLSLASFDPMRDVAVPAAQGAAKAQWDELVKAKQNVEQGRYSEAVGHGAAGVLPLVGPAAAAAGEAIAEGDVGYGLGQAVGQVGTSLLPIKAAKVKGVSVPAVARNANTVAREAVEFGLREGIPVDAAAATGNRAVRAAQHIADRSLGGAMVAGGEAQKQASALAAAGERLASKANRVTATAQTPGANLGANLPRRVQEAISDYVSSGQPARAAEVAEVVASEPGARAAITKAIRQQYGDEIPVYRAGEITPGTPQSWTTDPFIADSFGGEAMTGQARPVAAGTVKASDVLFPGAARDGELVIDSRLVKPRPAGGAPVTAEQAGQGVREAVRGNVRRSSGEADAAYTKLRELEANPFHWSEVGPTIKEGTSAAAEGVASQRYRFAAKGASTESLWQGALADARNSGFKGSADDLKVEFMDRLRSARSLQDDMAQAADFGDAGLVAEIRKLGGMRPFDRAHEIGAGRRKLRGDFQNLQQAFEKNWGQKGGGSIFRNDGLALDDLLTQLQEEGKFLEISDTNDLMRRLENMAAKGPEAKGRDIEDLLAQAGVKRGEKWWGEASEGAKPVPLAVDLRSAKEVLRPTYDALRQQAELTPAAMMGAKAQAYNALHKIMQGEDYLPLSVVDSALSDLKSFVRSDVPELRTVGQGIAAKAIRELDAAVLGRAREAGPDVLGALKEGRSATVRKHVAGKILEKLSKKEDVGVYRGATADGDSAIGQLRKLAYQAPDELPKIGRAYLDELLGKATAEGGFGHAAAIATQWRKLGTETKRLLYKDPAYIKDLDNFFELARLTSENANPSGTAHTLLVAGQGGLLLTDVTTGAASVIGTAALSKFLHSRAGVRLLTEGFRVPVGRKAAAAATGAKILQFAQRERISLMPMAAENQQETGSPIVQR
jgi:hypothetical protein